MMFLLGDFLIIFCIYSVCYKGFFFLLGGKLVIKRFVMLSKCLLNLQMKLCNLKRANGIFSQTSLIKSFPIAEMLFGIKTGRTLPT